MDNDLTRLPDEGPKASLLSAGQSFGQYRVTRLLGRGGMGEAYEVAHPVLEKRFVLKLLSPEIMSRPDAAERFKREAKVMARLEHPNIVKVDDFGETDGLTWLRMELMAGWQYEGTSHQSLQSLIKACAPLPESLVTQLIGQILKGLGEAHDSGAIHRDLKPSNILLQPNSLKPNGLQAKITDFGLVSLAGADWLQSQVQLTVAHSMAASTGSGQADPDATRMDSGGRMTDAGSQAGTSTQALLGTYAYMSPEQKKGLDVDARSDLYTLGLIAFQMLTGEETPGLEMPSDIVEELNPAWDDWVRQSVASRSERRFANAESMAEAMPGGDPSGLDETLSSPEVDQEADEGENAVEESEIPSPVPELQTEMPESCTEPPQNFANDNTDLEAKSADKSNAPVVWTLFFVVCVALVLIYISGISSDTSEGLEDGITALEQGHAYYYGDGVEQNYGEALKWYRKAASEGAAVAQNNLGVMYADGHGVVRDDAQAIRWYRMAADQEYANAQFNLGWMYQAGQGVTQDHVEAANLYLMAADQGHAAAQYNLGVMYLNGVGVAQSDSEALKFFRQSADQGYAPAQNNLALMYEHGRGVVQDYEEALKWYHLSADQGNDSSEYNLGEMYLYGLGVTQSDAEALGWYQMAADRGNAFAQYKLGWMYDTGRGVSEDNSKAIKFYRQSADQGVALAQYNLGLMYLDGEGVAEDFAEAFKWFSLAADQGNADAQYYLGWSYTHGRGVSKDYQEALKWYHLAAKQGHAGAYIDIALAHMAGKGVEQSEEAAVKWFRKAAETGDIDAQGLMGAAYKEGRGVEKNYVEARKWYRLAAEQGDSDAQCALGETYDEGLGVAEDDDEALKWFRKSAEQGNAEAKMSILLIEGKMTKKKLEEFFVKNYEDASLLNSFAWELISSKKYSIHWSDYALKLALQANEITEYNDGHYLDTLASCYAVMGNLELAIKLQRKALSVLRKDGSKYQHHIDEATHRLNLYLKRKNGLVETEASTSVEQSKIMQQSGKSLANKLDQIVMPQVNFSGMELTRVLETLAELSAVYDPDGKGVNIVPVFDPSQINPRVNISIKKLSLRRILDFVTQQVNFTYKVGADAVTVSPKD